MRYFYSSFPTPQALHQLLPTPKSTQQFVSNSRDAIRSILNQQDSRFLVIVGPCSIHNTDGAITYAKRLAAFQKEVKDRMLLVMRAYCEKPRSSCGWKGFIYDPDLNGEYNIEKGIKKTRELFLTINQLNIPIAVEFLDPQTPPFLADLISWGAIGARTSTSQIHRQLASGFSLPIGFKNDVHGCIKSAIHGILNAAQPHTFLAHDLQGKIATVKTGGNPDLHLVLRGGETTPNYTPNKIEEATNLLKEFNLPARLIVDCSHSNSPKGYSNQKKSLQSVISQHVVGNHFIRGIQLESYLKEGKQSLSNNTIPSADLSITDPCLSWETTEELLHWAYKHLKSMNTSQSITPCKL